jgi:hypothetical protein
VGAGLGEETSAARARVLHWTVAHGLDAEHGWAPPAAERGRQWRIHKQTRGVNNISLEVSSTSTSTSCKACIAMYF